MGRELEWDEAGQCWYEPGAGTAGGGGGGRSIRELRYREDGFTPAKRKIFLKALRKTGCVADAARKARVSTTTIDRLRRKFGDFNAQCEAARALALPALEAIAHQRATVGAPARIIRNGKLFEIRVQPSDAMLRMLMIGAAPHKYGRYAGMKGAAAQDGAAGGRLPKSMRSLPPEEDVRERIVQKVLALQRHRIRHQGYTRGPHGELVQPGFRVVSEEELARLGWTPPPETDAGEGKEAGAGGGGAGGD